MKLTQKFLKWSLMIPMLILLQSCTITPSRTKSPECNLIITYSNETQDKASIDLNNTSQDSPLRTMMKDYHILRDVIKVNCQ